MSFKGAIFDLDGVLVNTVPIHFKAWKQMFAEYGIDFTFDDYKEKVDGIPRYDGAKAILSDLNDEEIRKAGDRKQGYYLKFIEEENIPLYNSSVDLIKNLRDCGKRIAFASASRNCRRVLEKVSLIKLADAIVDGNDIKKGKPDPDIFLLSAERLSCQPQECVVFEDAVLGIEAAVNAGMICIGIDRYHNSERLAKADLVVEDLSKINFKTIEDLFKR
ncbi:MAG: beta-phosphoglucomutase family hydrolase [Candidatus Omnitrophica bacterium]|nr:beta-phosphoglucomutase family hydrolase [Candidatus Omnitrophota bacterium]